MERKNIIQRLVKEGMSEKTLANFNDRQISVLANRMLREAITTTVDAMNKNPKIATLAKTPGVDVQVVKETKKSPGNSKKPLSKFQSKKMDTDKDGDIDTTDLKNLRSKKKEVTDKEKPSATISKKKKSQTVKTDIDDKDNGKKVKESINKKPKAVTGAAMWKNIRKESKEVENWINRLIETEYHPFTSKAEILGLIEYKMGPGPGIAEPEIAPMVEPDVEPDIEREIPTPDDEPFYDPWETPGTNPDKRPKFKDNNSMPEFIKFKNLVNAYNKIK